MVQAFRGTQIATAHVAIAATRLLSESWPQTLEALAADELVSEFLLNFPVFPAWLEGRMTALRRRLLFDPEGELVQPLLASLAIQCHLNEYAWGLDALERQLVERLAERIDRLTPAEVMAVACYRRLSDIPGAEALLERGWTGPIEAVFEEQLARPREVRALAAAMPSLTPIREGVSQAVRGQYEIHPYPPWRRAGQTTVTHVNGRPLPENPEVLIAGCGTGRHAVEAALAMPTAQILAVDLSRASLAYGALKTREMGLADRLTFAQADLLELADGGATYDLVQAVGVVHHMADPFEGARAAARLVKPGGFLSLGLYSARARALLGPAKALAASYTPQTLRELRQDILARPDNDPVKAVAFNARDFYSLNGCRDLLMHVQEHQFGPIEVGRMVAECGVEFLGFEQLDAVRARYREMFPDDPAGLDFANWDAFEARNPSTFAAMYQFTAQKPH